MISEANKYLRKKYLYIAIRIVITSIVFYFIVMKVIAIDTTKVFSGIKEQPFFLFLGLIIYLLRHVILALRWWICIKVYGYNLPKHRILLDHFKIGFLEIITPIPDAEDGLRVIFMKRYNLPITDSIIAVIYDRVMGVLFLCVLLPLTILSYSGIIDSNKAAIIYLLIAFFISIILFRAFILRILFKLISIVWNPDILFIDKINKLIKKDIPFLWKLITMLLCIVQGLFSVLIIVFILKIWAVSVPFYLLFVALPILYISVIVPVSIQGLGLFEAALVLILIHLGIEESIAISAGVLHFLYNLIYLSIGGAIFLFSRSELRKN